MSTSEEIRELREEVRGLREALGAPSAADAPKTRDELMDLVNNNPDRFNSLLDAGLIDLSLANQGADDE